MAVFHKTSKQVLQLNAVLLVLFVFGPGLAPPAQSSAGPPSTCAAPYIFYERVALLHNMFIFSVLASCYMAMHVQSTVATEDGEIIQCKHAAKKLRMRVSLLVAIGFSVATAGLAIAVSTYILQLRYTVFACMPSGIRSVVFAADAVVALVCTYTYAIFIATAITGV